MNISSADPRLAPLTEYREELEALLGMLDDEGQLLEGAILQSWQRCNAIFGRFQRLHAELNEEEPPAEVMQAVKDSMRLNAVAVSELARHKEALFSRKSELKRTQAMLDSQRTYADNGRSCDLSG